MKWNEWLEQIKKNWFVSSILLILVGLLLVIFPDHVMRDLCYIVAGASIALGVVRIVAYYKQDHTYPFLFQSDLLMGMLILGLGLFTLLHPDTMRSLIPIVFGVILIGCGIGNILRAVDAKKAGVKLWGVLLAVQRMK